MDEAPKVEIKAGGLETMRASAWLQIPFSMPVPLEGEFDARFLDKLGFLEAVCDADPNRGHYHVNDVLEKLSVHLDHPFVFQSKSPLGLKNLHKKLWEYLEIGKDITDLNKILRSRPGLADVSRKELSFYVIDFLLAGIFDGKTAEELALTDEQHKQLQRLGSMWGILDKRKYDEVKAELLQGDDQTFKVPLLDLKLESLDTPEAQRELGKIAERPPETRVEVKWAVANIFKELNKIKAGFGPEDDVRLGTENILQKKPGENLRQALLRELSTLAYCARNRDDLFAFIGKFASDAVNTDLRVVASTLLDILDDKALLLNDQVLEEIFSFADMANGLPFNRYWELGIREIEITTEQEIAVGIYADTTLNSLLQLNSFVPKECKSDPNNAYLALGRLDPIAWIWGAEYREFVNLEQITIGSLGDSEEGEKNKFSMIANYRAGKTALQALANRMGVKEYAVYGRLLVESSKKLDEAAYTLIYHALINSDIGIDKAEIKDIFWGKPDRPNIPQFRLLESDLDPHERSRLRPILAKLPEQVRFTIIEIIPSLRLDLELREEVFEMQLGLFNTVKGSLNLEKDRVNAELDTLSKQLDAEPFDPDVALAAITEIQTIIENDWTQKNKAIGDLSDIIESLERTLKDVKFLHYDSKFQEQISQFLLMKVTEQQLQTELVRQANLRDVQLDDYRLEVESKANRQTRELVSTMAFMHKMREPLLGKLGIDKDIHPFPTFNDDISKSYPFDMSTVIMGIQAKLEIAMPAANNVSHACRVISYFGLINKYANQSKLSKQEVTSKFIDSHFREVQSYLRGTGQNKETANLVILHALLNILNIQRQVIGVDVSPYVHQVLTESGYGWKENPSYCSSGIIAFDEANYPVKFGFSSRLRTLRSKELDAMDVEEQMRIIGEFRQLAEDPTVVYRWFGLPTEPPSLDVLSGEVLQIVEGYVTQRAKLEYLRDRSDLVPEVAKRGDVTAWIEKLDEIYVNMAFKLLNAQLTSPPLNPDGLREWLVNQDENKEAQAVATVRFLVEGIDNTANKKNEYLADPAIRKVIKRVFAVLPSIQLIVQDKVEHAFAIPIRANSTTLSNLQQEAIQNNNEVTDKLNKFADLQFEPSLSLAGMQLALDEINNLNTSDIEDRYQEAIEIRVGLRESFKNKSLDYEWLEAIWIEGGIEASLMLLDSQYKQANVFFEQLQNLKERKAHLLVAVEQKLSKKLSRLPQPQAQFIMGRLQASHPELVGKSVDTKANPYPENVEFHPPEDTEQIISTYYETLDLINNLHTKPGIHVDDKDKRNWIEELNRVTRGKVLEGLQTIVPDNMKNLYQSLILGQPDADVDTSSNDFNGIASELNKVLKPEQKAFVADVYMPLQIWAVNKIKNAEYSVQQAVWRKLAELDSLLVDMESDLEHIGFVQADARNAIGRSDPAALEDCVKAIEALLGDVINPFSSGDELTFEPVLRNAQKGLDQLLQKFINEGDVLGEHSKLNDYWFEYRSWFRQQNPFPSELDLVKKTMELQVQVSDLSSVYDNLQDLRVKLDKMKAQQADALEKAVRTLPTAAEAKDQTFVGRVRHEIADKTEVLGAYGKATTTRLIKYLIREGGKGTKFTDLIRPFLPNGLSPEAASKEQLSDAGLAIRQILTESVQGVDIPDAYLEILNAARIKVAKLPKPRRFRFDRYRGRFAAQVNRAESLGWQNIYQKKGGTFGQDEVNAEVKDLPSPGDKQVEMLINREGVVFKIKTRSGIALISRSFAELREGEMVRLPEDWDINGEPSETHTVVFHVRSLKKQPIEGGGMQISDFSYDVAVFKKPQV